MAIFEKAMVFWAYTSEEAMLKIDHYEQDRERGKGGVQWSKAVQ